MQKKSAYTERPEFSPLDVSQLETSRWNRVLEPRSVSDLVRSQENIKRWLEYLPADCIETMVRLGWDVST